MPPRGAIVGAAPTPETFQASGEATDLPLAAELLKAGADRKDPLGYPSLCLAAALGNAQMELFKL